jgi:chemotaxis protein CheD
MLLTVDMADLAASADATASLLTFSLGSCIAVSVYDVDARVGGLLHFMLPESSIAPAQARDNPAMFADTGLVALFTSAYALGAEKSRLRVKVAGGSQLLSCDGSFDIGKRNYLALLRILRRNGVKIDAEDVGGGVSRGMRLDIGNGAVTVKTRNGEVSL